MNRNFGEAASLSGRLPIYFFVSVALVLLLGAPQLACSRQSGQPSVGRVSFATEDGVTLTASLYQSKEARSPGILLLHRYGGNRDVWESIALLLQQHGVMVLALDLRGHGDSRVKNGESLHYRQVPDTAWLEALEDVRAAKAFLVEQGAHPDNLAVAGEGLGASLALYYALESPNVQAVIMISPGLETQGILTEDAIKRLVDCPTLLMAGEGDAYAAMSATALNAAAPVYSELRTFSGGTHGVDLFAAHPEAAQFMLDWLLKIFAAESP